MRQIRNFDPWRPFWCYVDDPGTIANSILEPFELVYMSDDKLCPCVPNTGWAIDGRIYSFTAWLMVVDIPHNKRAELLLEYS